MRPGYRGPSPRPNAPCLWRVDSALAHEVDHRLWVETLFAWAEGLGGYEGLAVLGRLEHDPRSFSDVIPWTNFEERRARLHAGLRADFRAALPEQPAASAPAGGWSGSGSAPPLAPPRTAQQIVAEFFYANRAPGETPYKP